MLERGKELQGLVGTHNIVGPLPTWELLVQGTYLQGEVVELIKLLGMGSLGPLHVAIELGRAMRKYAEADGLGAYPKLGAHIDRTCPVGENTGAISKGGSNMVERGYVDTPDGQMHYMAEGEGEPLILLHQGCRSSRMYRKMIPLLSPRYRAIAMDLMGFGNSDIGPSMTPSLLDRARNVYHFIDALGIEKCHLFGLHTGAALGAVMAANWPEKVTTLTLFGFPYAANDEERRELVAHEERTTGLPPPTMSMDWLPMDITPDGSHLTIIWARTYSEVLRWWLHSAPPWAPDFYPNPLQSVHRWATPEILEFMEVWTVDFLQQMTRGPRPTLSDRQSDRANLLLEDIGSHLHNIKAPTLLIEPDSPYENFFCRRNREVQELIPNSKAVVLPDSDDNAAEFRAPQVVEMILGFVGQHRL